MRFSVKYRIMRISVDIDEATLNEVMAMTCETRKSPALSKAIVEFTRRRKAKEFGRLIRENFFDYPNPDSEKVDLANPVPPLSAD